MIQCKNELIDCNIYIESAAQARPPIANDALYEAFHLMAQKLPLQGKTTGTYATMRFLFGFAVVLRFIRVWVLFHDIWCLRAGPRATGWLDWIGLWVFRKPHKVYGNWSRQRKMNNQRRPPESLFIAAQKHFISRSYPAVSQPPWVNPTLLVAARPTIGGGVGL